jgi:hypothetical protein
VNLRRELNHSSLRNQVTWRVIAAARRWPRATRLARSLAPALLRRWLFPEQQHLDRRTSANRPPERRPAPNAPAEWR